MEEEAVAEVVAAGLLRLHPDSHLSAFNGEDALRAHGNQLTGGTWHAEPPTTPRTEPVWERRPVSWTPISPIAWTPPS